MTTIGRPTPAPAHRRPRNPVRGRQYAVAALLLVTIALVTASRPSFASLENIRDLLVQSAPAVIVGCGMTFVILTGEIDISVGSLLGVLAVLMGMLSSPQHAGLPLMAVAAITLGAGACVGLINGLLVTLGRVPSIIATLGMLTVLRGVTEWLMGGHWITDLPRSLRALGTGAFLRIPYSVWTAVLVAAASLLLARGTPLGLRLYATGDNPEAAAHARIPLRSLRLFAFTLTGLLTAVAALVSVPQQSVVESGIGSGFELVVVTAVVVGGTSIRGGAGGVAGTVLAALLLGSIRTILVFLNLGEMTTYWERAIQGAFILAAVLADHLARPATGRAPRLTGAGA